MCPVAANRFHSNGLRAAAGLVPGISQACRPGGERHQNDQRRDNHRTVMPGYEHAGDRPEQNRDKGAGLDERISEQELMRREQIRKDRVFERAQERRLDPHHKQDDEQCRSAAEQHARCRRNHQRNFAELDQPDQPRLVVLVGELTGGRRAQEERQDEEPAGERDHDLRRSLRGGVGAVGDHQHQGVLDCVVVECRQELRRK